MQFLIKTILLFKIGLKRLLSREWQVEKSEIPLTS
jgi:hypothetical protein